MKHLLTLTALFISSLAMGQFPNLPYNPDDNGDGLIGVSDLQSFLALYNTEFSAAVSGNGIVFIELGSMNKPECYTACNDLPGRWRVSSFLEVTENWELFAETIAWEYAGVGSSNDSDPFWLSHDWSQGNHPLNQEQEGARFDDSSGGWSIVVMGLSDKDNHRCVCSITERPKIEYQRIAQDGSDTYMNTIVNEFLNEGWYIQSNDELYMHLWRWKD